MSALDQLVRRVRGAKQQDVGDLPAHPGLARGWKLHREMANRLRMPGPGDELAPGSWASWLAHRAGQVLRQACTGNRTTLRDALVDLGVVAIMWAEAVERRGP